MFIFTFKFSNISQKFGGEGVNELIFWWWEDSSIIPAGKTLNIPCQQVFIYNKEDPCTSHRSYVEVAILLLQDLSTLCDIYGVCFHLSVQCLYCNKFITS